MTRGIRKHKEVLKKLQRAKPSERRNILHNADCGLVKCLCTIVHNILNGVIHLKPCQRSKLQRYRHVLRKLALNGETWEDKKKIFTQTGGGFLPLLLAPLISTLFSKIFS